MEKYGRFDFSPWKHEYLAQNRQIDDGICWGRVWSFHISISCIIEVRGAPFHQVITQFPHKGDKVLGYKDVNMNRPSQRSIFFKAEFCSGVFSAVICRSKTSTNQQEDFQLTKRPLRGVWAITWGKGAPLTSIMHEIEIWKGQTRPQHLPSLILAGFGPDIHVFTMKNQISHIFPFLGGSPFLTVILSQVGSTSSHVSGVKGGS